MCFMRLDILLTNRKLVKSRSTASDLIKNSLVKVNGEIVTKPAKDYLDTENDKNKLIIEILEQPKYVSRGGLKLEKALTEFQIDPKDLIVLDVGASTGGFTDCLLQKGAKKVYAVDVGTDQLDASLKNNPRLISLEKTDIRNIKTLPLNSPQEGESKPSLAVIDASFISLELILENTAKLLTEKGQIIALIKPQFETQKEAKNKSGIVKTDILREQVLEKIKNHCQKINLKILNIIDSPILGGSGNKEYLILLQK
jgi:23S rRNA (cytidine1920-2'-O)/16S rRNA (cytidine1409-2'-O)-methyltransferase